jgi:4-carboxymuconolactone decarboxylase
LAGTGERSTIFLRRVEATVALMNINGRLSWYRLMTRSFGSRVLLALSLPLALGLSTVAVAAHTSSKPISGVSMLSENDVRSVSPALDSYTQAKLLGEIWKRPNLSPRDRSIVTLAALIARNQTIEMPYHFNLALDNGVKPAEISEIIFHLAFYSGWPNAMSAVMIAKDIFAQRGIRADQLPPVSPTLLPIDYQ